MSLPETATNAPPPRPREARRSRNSQAIVAAAHRLIAEKGEGFTTQELIKEAGVALQTFYRHFPGKDQLLLAVIEDLIAEHCKALAARAQLLDDPVARLHLFVTVSLESLNAAPNGNPRFITSEHWRLHQVDPEAMSAATKPFADLVQQELEAAHAVGLLSPRDPERDAWLIAKIVMAAFHHYAFHPDDPAVETIADDVWQFCLAAVGGTPTSRRRGFTRRRR